MTAVMSSLEAGLIGQEAPDFTLKDQRGEEFRLSACRGKRVVLLFLPPAWTEDAAEQVKVLSSSVPTFESLKAVAVAISVDSAASLKAWADYLAITNLRLLSDFWPHGLVACEYEVLRQLVGFPETACVVVNESGRIGFFRRYKTFIADAVVDALKMQ